MHLGRLLLTPLACSVAVPPLPRDWPDCSETGLVLRSAAAYYRAPLPPPLSGS